MIICMVSKDVFWMWVDSRMGAVPGPACLSGKEGLKTFESYKHPSSNKTSALKCFMVYKRHLNYLHLALAIFSYNGNLPLYLIFHLMNPNLELENTYIAILQISTHSSG